MNRVQLIGDLVLPVEVRRDRITGRTVGKALIAVSDGVEGTMFVPVTLSGEEALDAARHLGEGSRLDMVGHLHSALLAGRDAHGARRARRLLYVIVDRTAYVTIRPPHGGDRQ